MRPSWQVALIWESIKSGAALENPVLLNKFLLLTFAVMAPACGSSYWGAEVGRSSEPGRLRLQQAVIALLHSSLDSRHFGRPRRVDHEVKKSRPS
ncbi:Ubiquitin-like modifier-activating enzyme ATG7 [Plecturocebus cupreus]